MVCFGTPSGVLVGELGEVESVDVFNNKACKVILGESFVYRRAQGDYGASLTRF